MKRLFNSRLNETTVQQSIQVTMNNPKYRLLVLILLLASCVGPPEMPSKVFAPDSGIADSGVVEYQCTGEDTHPWGLRWPTNIVIEVVDQTGDAAYLVEQIVADWNGLDLPVSLRYRTGTETIDTANGIILFGSVDEGAFKTRPEVLGDSSGTFIRAGKVMIHSKILTYGADSIQHIVCRALGNTLGLRIVEGVTCMDDCSWAAENGSIGQEWVDCMEDPERASPGLIDECQMRLSAGL